MHRANLFTAIVGSTAKGRKGTSFDDTVDLFRRADPGFASTDHIGQGLSSGEGLIYAVRDPITKRVTHREKGREPWEEEQVLDEGIADKRLVMVESELSGPLRAMGRDGNTLSAMLRTAWDGGDIRTMTRNSPLRATGPHIGLIGHVTIDELRRCLDRTELVNGFANRFLLVCAKRSNWLPEPSELPAGRTHELARELRSALTKATDIGPMSRDDAARALWRERYRELSEGKPGLGGAAANRAEAQTLRLSMIYALMHGRAEIGERDLRAALDFWRYCEQSALYVFGDATGDPIADTILGGLATAGPAGLTRTGFRDLFNRHASTASIDRALENLVAIGRVAFEREPTKGAPRTVYRLAGARS